MNFKSGFWPLFLWGEFTLATVLILFAVNGASNLLKYAVITWCVYGTGGIRFTSFQCNKKFLAGKPYLDIVTLLVPEHVSTSNLMRLFEQGLIRFVLQEKPPLPFKFLRV